MRTQSKLREYAVFEGITQLLGFTLFMEMPAVNFYCLKRTLGKRVVNQEIYVRERASGKYFFLFVQHIPVCNQS